MSHVRCQRSCVAKLFVIYSEPSFVFVVGEAWCLKLSSEIKLLEVLHRKRTPRDTDTSDYLNQSDELQLQANEARHHAARLQTQALGEAQDQVRRAYEMFTELKDVRNSKKFVSLDLVFCCSKFTRRLSSSELLLTNLMFLGKWCRFISSCARPTQLTAAESFGCAARSRISSRQVCFRA